MQILGTLHTTISCEQEVISERHLPLFSHHSCLLVCYVGEGIKSISIGD
jgi:hypothetical protein